MPQAANWHYLELDLACVKQDRFSNGARGDDSPGIPPFRVSQRLKVFPISQLSLGFPQLIALMNFFPSPFKKAAFELDFRFSSA